MLASQHEAIRATVFKASLGLRFYRTAGITSSSAMAVSPTVIRHRNGADLACPSLGTSEHAYRRSEGQSPSHRREHADHGKPYEKTHFPDGAYLG